MQDSLAALPPQLEVSMTVQDEAIRDHELSEPALSEDGELHNPTRKHQVDVVIPPEQQVHEAHEDGQKGNDVGGEQNAAAATNSDGGSAGSWLPRGDLHESSPAQDAPPPASSGTVATRRIRDLTPKSASQVPLPVSMFCILRDDPPPPSHTPYEYLVVLPFRTIGPVIVGTGGRTKRRICDVSNLAEMRVLFTLDGKCFLHLFGSKSSIIDALDEIRQLVFRPRYSFWNAWEENELKRRGDEWTRWADQRAERIPGAWLRDSYSSSSRPTAQSRARSIAPLSYSSRDFPVGTANRWAPPAQQGFNSTGTQYGIPTMRDRFVGASGGVPRSPPRATSSQTQSLRRGEFMSPTPHSPPLQQKNSSLSSMDTDSMSNEAQDEFGGKARKFIPSPARRKRAGSSSPAKRQQDSAKERTRGGVPFDERDEGEGAVLGGSRHRSLDAKSALPGKRCCIEISPSAIGHFVGLTSCVPYIGLVTGSAIKVEATPTSTQVIIEGGDLEKAKEMVEGVTGKELASSSPVAPLRRAPSPTQRSARKRNRSRSRKSSLSTDIGGPYSNSIPPAERTSPDTSFDTLQDGKGPSDKTCSGEALERQLRDAARASALKRRKRQDEEAASVDSASFSGKIDRTRQWVDGVDRSANASQAKGSTYHKGSSRYASDPYTERTSRPTFEAPEPARPRVFEQPQRSKPVSRQDSPGVRIPASPPVRERRPTNPSHRRLADSWNADGRSRGTRSDDRWQKGTGSYRPERDPVNVRGYGWGEKGWHQTYSYGRERGGVNR